MNFEDIPVIDLETPGDKQGMALVLQTFYENAAFRDRVLYAVGELAYYSWKDDHKPTDERREAYLTSNEADRARIVAIGEELNSEGGLYLMRFVAENCRPTMKGPHDLRTLDFAWNGIGDWRC